MTEDPRTEDAAEAERASREFFDRMVLNVDGDDSRYASVVGMAFGDARTHAYGDVVLDEVRLEWRAADKRARRVLILSCSVATAFVLAGAGNASELTIAGVKADAQGVDLIVKFLPALALALAAEALVQIRLISEYQSLYSSLLRRLHPNVRWGSLDFAIAPQSISFWSGDWTMLVGRYKDSRASWLLLAINIVNALASALAPLAFAVYAYASLFDRFGTSDELVWLSLGIGVLNIARYIARLFDGEEPAPATRDREHNAVPAEDVSAEGRPAV